MGRLWFGREWFRRHLAPALRWLVKGGDRPSTEEEKSMRGWQIDLDAVRTPSDMELYWNAQERWGNTPVPKEVGRRG